MRSNRARILRANLEQRQAERPPKAFTTSHMCSLSSTLTLPNDEKFDAKQSRTRPPRQPRATSGWTTSQGLHNVPHALTVFNFDSCERRKVWCEAIAHASSAPTSSNVRVNDLPRPSQSATCAHCLQLGLFRTTNSLVRSNRARILRANLEQRQGERPPKAFTKCHMCSLSSTLTLPNGE